MALSHFRPSFYCSQFFPPPYGRWSPVMPSLLGHTPHHETVVEHPCNDVCPCRCRMDPRGEVLHNSLHLRFASHANTLSDTIRKEQSQALWEEIYLHPFIGKGLGGYTEKSIRGESPSMYYLYEVQWLSFLMQFGVIGLSLLLGAAFILIIPAFTPPWRQEKRFLATLYLVWLASGLTNPYLLSLTSGIVYALFHVGARTLAKPAIAQRDPPLQQPKVLLDLIGTDRHTE